MSVSDIRMRYALERALLHFELIDTYNEVSEEDRSRLKEAYLKNYFEPETQALLRTKLEEQGRLSPQTKPREPANRIHRRP